MTSESTAAPVASSRLRPTAPVAQKLIQATIDAIDADGESAVRVQEIVATVGVSIPVLYQHFGNREGLVQAAQAHRLIEDRRRELDAIRRLVDSADSAEDLDDVITGIITRAGGDERRVLRWRRVNVLGSTYGRAELYDLVAQLQEESTAEFADVLRGPQSKGWLKEGLDLEVFATWFAGLMIGRFVMDLKGPDVDQTAYDSLVADSVRHTLFG